MTNQISSSEFRSRIHQFSNQALMAEKIHAVENLGAGFFSQQGLIQGKESPEQFCFNFHGLNIVFYYFDERLANFFHNDFGKKIGGQFSNPSSSKLGPDLSFFITLDGNDANQGQFSNEINPDCLVFESFGLELAIQRDFIGKDDLRGHVYLLVHEELEDGIYNALRWSVPRRLLDKRALLLHSSCVVDHDNRACLFLGHSGAGKTTVASFAGTRKVLGDDMNVVRFENGHIYAYAANLGGAIQSEFSGNGFLVKGVYWLQKSAVSQVIPLAPGQLTQKLLVSAANIFVGDHKMEPLPLVMNLIGPMANSLNGYILNFKKDEEFWNAIQ